MDKCQPLWWASTPVCDVMGSLLSNGNLHRNQQHFVFYGKYKLHPVVTQVGKGKSPSP